MKLREITDLVKGRLEGDGELEIRSVAGLEEAREGELTFYANLKYKCLLAGTKASAVMLGEKENTAGISAATVRVSNVYYALAKVLEKLYPAPEGGEGVHETSVIGKNVKLPASVCVGANAVICDGVMVGDGSVIGAGNFIGKGTVIGRNALLYPNVTVYHGTEIGNNVIIHAGTVIGSDGFGYATEQGSHYKIPQVGNVVIEDNVEIGANVAIDRAATGHTVIGSGTKIDNLVMIAHNVKIGKHCFIVAQTGISGSTVIGNNVILAGQSGIAGHLKVGDYAVVGAQAGVTKDVPSKTVVSGYPAREHSEAKKINAYVARLGKLYADVKALNDIIRKGSHGKTKDD